MENKNWIKQIAYIQKMVISLFAGIICLWAFFQNNGLSKVILSPFIICSFAMFVEMVCLLLNRKKIARFFQFLFRISFFLYFFGFLVYALYYTLLHKSYEFLFLIFLFFLFGLYFLKKCFFTKRKEEQSETQEK